MEPIQRTINNSEAIVLKASNILELPKELLEIILSHVPVTSSQSVMLACKKFRAVVIDSQRVQRSWYRQEYQYLRLKYGNVEFKPTNANKFIYVSSHETAAKEYFTHSADEIIKDDATIEQMQHESARMRRAQEYYHRNKRAKCLESWRWVILTVTCCGCCGVFCCAICLFNKICYDSCSLEPPFFHQEDKKPLG